MSFEKKQFETREKKLQRHKSTSINTVWLVPGASNYSGKAITLGSILGRDKVKRLSSCVVSY